MNENRKTKASAKRGAGAHKKIQTANLSGGEPSASVASESLQGKPEEKHARPVWVHESDAADITDYKTPSALLFTCACAFVCDMAIDAYNKGDNDLLSYEGMADALEFIERGDWITGSKEYAEMLIDWKDDNKRKQHLKYDEFSDIEKTFARAQFWNLFDERWKVDIEKQESRQYYLAHNPFLDYLIRNLKQVKDNPKTPDDLAFVDKMTDGFIIGIKDIKNPKPARVRADWLNGMFNQAGAALVRWLNIAELPKYNNVIIELRERILHNWGVFPAPFCADGECVRLNTDELTKLIFIARAMARDKRETSAAANPSGDSLPECITGKAGQWAISQGVKNYNGRYFSFNGVPFEKGNSNKRWWIIAKIIESREADGAAKVERTWRGKFSGANSEWQMLLKHIHPLTETRGGGFVRIEKREKNKERKPML